MDISPITETQKTTFFWDWNWPVDVPKLDNVGARHKRVFGIVGVQFAGG